MTLCGKALKEGTTLQGEHLGWVGCAIKSVEGGECGERVGMAEVPVPLRPPYLTSIPSDAIVHGIVWLDADANGVRAANETVYSGGVTVELRQGSTVIATTTTNSSGQYVFRGVPPGAYSVRFVSPAGFVFSPSNQGTDDSKDSDADPSTGSSGTFTLTSGQDLAGPDAGIYSGVASCRLLC